MAEKRRETQAAQTTALTGIAEALGGLIKQRSEQEVFAQHAAALLQRYRDARAVAQTGAPSQEPPK